MPDFTDDLRARLAPLGLSGAREAEIIEELSQHLEERYQELRSGGAGEEEARRLTLEELLDEDSLANHLRSLRQSHPYRPSTSGAPRRSLAADTWQDVRYTVRTLRKRPAFAAAAILTLALGVGATTAIFSVVNGVLLKPLPYPDPDALVRIVHSIGGVQQQFFSDAIFLNYVENTRTFADLGVWSPAARATITGAGDPEEVRALRASRGILTTLGVRPEMGRWFSAADDTPGAPGTVIVTSGYWRRRLGADPGVLERTLTVDGLPHRVVGVMPADFRFSRDFDIVLPLRINEAAPRADFRLVGLARLKPGVSLAQANADVDRVLDIWFSRSGGNQAIRARWAPSLQPLMQDVVGDIGTTLWVLMGAIVVVLVMACANVANLLLVRADARRQELAVRAAVGADMARVARQLLVESLTLALVGGAIGVALAYGGVRALVAVGPANVPRLAEIAVDPVVLAFALMISIASGLLFGLVPILKYARPRLADVMGAGRNGSMTRERQRSQQVLVAAQMALALVLLVSAGLMIRSFQALRSVEAGFTRPEQIQTFGISIPPDVVAEPERVMRMQQALLDKVGAIPGVTATSFMTRLPMGGDRFSSALLPEGTVVDDSRTPPNRHAKVVSPGAFHTLGTRIIAGRDFTWADVYDRRQVAIVSERLAREMWGASAAAIGKRFREYYDDKGPWWEVVGVVANVHDDGVDRPAPDTVYWPAQPGQRLMGLARFQARRVSVVMRTDDAGTERLLDQVREAVWSVNPALPLAQVSTLDEIYRASMARTSFTLVMLAIAGTMALLLGMAGIYGVISYAVSQRRREIGIRLAIGAQAQEIRALFVRRGLILAGIGLAAGLTGALGVTRLMQSLLFGISPLDPATFAAAPLGLAIVAVLASYLPARRAVAVDPVETMRSE
jgi:putative ABC transport system permease protein